MLHLFLGSLPNITQLAEVYDNDPSIIPSKKLSVPDEVRTQLGKEIKQLYTNSSFKDDIGAFVRVSKSKPSFSVYSLIEKLLKNLRKQVSHCEWPVRNVQSTKCRNKNANFGINEKQNIQTLITNYIGIWSNCIVTIRVFWK